MADLSFNSNDLTSYVYVEEIRTSLTPDVRHYARAIPGRTGVLLGERQIGPRTISVDVRIIKNARTEVTSAATSLAGLLLTDGPKKLETRRDSGRWWMAVYQGSPPLEQLFTTGFATLEFLAPDGVMFSDEQTVALSAGANTKKIEGTADMFPVITMKLASAANEAKILHNGKTVRIKRSTGTWAANTEIVFDYVNRLVYLESGGDLLMEYMMLDSRWGPVTPGDAKSFTLTSGGATMKYYPRWV